MSDTLTQIAFAPHRGTVFVAQADDADSVELALLEVNDKTPSGFRGEQFSLIFQGPSDRQLSQRIHALDHPKMGKLDLFLVPIGVRDTGRLYEAFFNLQESL